MTDPRNTDIIAKIQALPKFGNGLGLHRMQFLAEQILASTWYGQIDPIHVVGSNGKGSTTLIIANVLKELGIVTGQYTSPHLFSFTERIVVDGQQISIADLADTWQHFLAKKEVYGQQAPEDFFGAFEAITFLAVQYFQHFSAEAIVLEAGIGGRFDSTKIFNGSHVGLTSIDLEHSSILGNTKEEIAFDKIDMARDGGTIVLGNLEKELKKKAIQYARQKSLTVLCIQDEIKVENFKLHPEKMTFDLQWPDFKIANLTSSLIGEHQVNNICVALVLLRSWLEKNQSAITRQQFQNAIRPALAQINWPGRIQKICHSPDLYIDVAHTPDSIAQLIATFQAIHPAPCLLITGVSYDKNYPAIIQQLAPLASVIVCTSAYHKGADAKKIYDIAKEAVPSSVQVFKKERIEEAVDFGRAYAVENNLSILIAGGLFLSIEANHYVIGNDPQTLSFL